MKVGTYTLTVRDRSRFHNAHVVGPGYNRKTTLAFVGTQRWKVRLARAGTLRFLCDPHASDRHARLGEDRPLALPRVSLDGQTDLPPMRHTGPCVAARSVSARPCSTVTRPVIPSASMRSRQRRVMPGEVP